MSRSASKAAWLTGMPFCLAEDEAHSPEKTIYPFCHYKSSEQVKVPLQVEEITFSTFLPIQSEIKLVFKFKYAVEGNLFVHRYGGVSFLLEWHCAQQ